MKKIFKLLIIAIFLLTGTNAFAANKKTIVCTSFPEYDWVMNILGSNSSAIDVILLQNNGTDLHSYQPSFKDIVKISTSDLFIYNGGESSKWVKDVISSAKNKNQIAFNMLESLGDYAREEEIVEGMQAEEEETEDEDEDEPEYDEHIWLSLKNAIKLVNLISRYIQKLDLNNASLYKRNTEDYIKQLSALDKEYAQIADSAAKKTVLFCDRFPFRYLTDDYGLKYYAAFAGCSAESEASFDTIIFLSKKVDELGLKSVFILEKSDRKIAKTVISNTKAKNQQILVMDSLQSITQKEIKDGRNYLSAMKNNLKVLQEALK